MKFSAVAAIALAGFASAQYSNGTSAAAAANGTMAYATEVVTSYTTYCPAPTVVFMNGKQYTVTEATTLTITDCPCTLTKSMPVAAITPSMSPSMASPAKNNGTATVSKPAAFTGGAAANNFAVAGSGLLAFAGAAVVLL